MHDSPFEAICNSIGHALHVGFGDIEYIKKDWVAFRETGDDIQVKSKRQHAPHEIVVAAMFPQTWGSTALGFGGIGGAAMTSAYTVIVSSLYTSEHLVYFGGRFAYRVSAPNETFHNDMNHRNMSDVADHGKYERKKRTPGAQ